MKTVEAFELKQSKMSDSELINLCDKEVGELASTYGKSHRMTIPPMVTDTDMLLSELIKRFKMLSEAICWRDPNTDPPINQDVVLVKTDNNCYSTAYYHGDASGFITYGEDAYVEFGEIIGWRPIE